MISPTIITTGVSLVTGFVFRYIAERRKEQHEQFKFAIGKMEAHTKSADAAANRGGVWVRRFLVASLVVATILVPAVNGFFGFETTIAVEVDRATSWLGKLFRPGTTTELVTISSYYASPEVFQGLMLVIGFYFGQGAAK